MACVLRESMVMCANFNKRGEKGQDMFKKDKKGQNIENLGKNVQNLKIFSERAGDCVRLLHAKDCYNSPCGVHFGNYVLDNSSWDKVSDI